MAEFRHLVRIANTDIRGDKPLFIALQKIKGIGENFSRCVCKLANIDYMSKTGELSDKSVDVIEKVISDPLKSGIPTYYVNRQKDFETGDDKHLINADLAFTKDNDIKMMKKTKSYKGLRHQWNLPVRGQRTQSNFRPNKGRGGAVKKRTTVRK